MVAMPKVEPLIVIVGPTAMGKSDLAIKLAQKINGAIVSADSWLVRQEVNIGTAKPDLADRQLVEHYMIDIVRPCDYYSAALYKEEANEAIRGIYDEGRIPILVGGTGLYVDSLIYDYSFLPNPSLKQRSKLNSMALTELIKLANVNQIDLSSIDQRNKRRVIRAIETNGAVPDKKSLRDNTLIIGIRTDKAALEARIMERVDKMIDSGLEIEVKSLSERYGWDCEALKGIGYHEWRLYFEGNQSLDETRYRIIKDTLALSKRQLTWFKRNISIRWYSIPVNYHEIEDLVTTFLNKDVS